MFQGAGCLMPRRIPSAFQIDLFGEIAPLMAATANRRRGRAKAAEAELAELREDIERVLADVRCALEDALAELETALGSVDMGEKDCAIEALDQSIAEALADARRELAIDD